MCCVFIEVIAFENMCLIKNEFLDGFFDFYLLDDKLVMGSIKIENWVDFVRFSPVWRVRTDVRWDVR